MSALKLRDGVWSVGVLNPSLRVFDIVISSPYGTSYNAYLLTGEKNVLIETVHKDYFDEFVANIEQVLPIDQIDYLIMNHTEPDHSGSVALLLARCPKLTVLCSTAAKMFLGAISNKEFPCRIVGDGDTLELGEKTLHFISAPFLHWPDSMFTWDPADKTLFTCDFLGTHFCCPQMMDTAMHENHRLHYVNELKNYFDGIFGPFKPSVLAGLSKIPAETTLVCPSHGPCLSELLPQVRAQYLAWSTPAVKTQKTASVLYCSAYGCTGALATAAAEKLTALGFAVSTLDVTYAPAGEAAALAESCDVLLMGSPTINRAVPGPIMDVLSSVDAIGTKGRAAGAFGAFGWSGEAAPMLLARLKSLGFATPDAPFKVNFTPTETDLENVANYAAGVAALVK